MTPVDLILINPNNKRRAYGTLAAGIAGIEPPLWTGLLAAYVREKGGSVRIIDAEAEGWDADLTLAAIKGLDSVLIGISAIGINPSASSTPKMEAARVLLEKIRTAGIKARTFLYGIHPSALVSGPFVKNLWILSAAESAL